MKNESKRTIARLAPAVALCLSLASTAALADRGRDRDNDPPRQVPEPGTLVLLGAGLLGMRAISRRR